jgi:SAM-dependent methyltransferase
MRGTAPQGFKAEEFYEGVLTFQDWEIFPGHRVKGSKPVARDLGLLGVPERLEGSPRVLEIGPWNGFFGFELLRRGASELVGLGPDDPNQTAYLRTVSLLEVESRVRYICDSVYNIARYDLDKFDIVMFLGVIYHLRHPLLALDALYDHCHPQTMFLLDTPTIDDVGRIADEPDHDAMREPWKAVGHIPLTAFVRGGMATPLAADAYNWFIPNSVCLHGWMASSGFEIVHEYVANNWMWVQARQTARPFEQGFEGYNSARATQDR